MADGPVDMRMDRSRGRTAADIVNHAPEHEIADLLFHLGDERRSRRIARAIVRARPIRDTRHLADVIESAAPRSGPIHPATRSFMALRIAVNDEAGELKALLDAAPKLVRSGGRMVVLTFMSAEDRMVKQAFQQLGREGRALVLTKHVVPPGKEEVRVNPPSRSAKLRAVEMK
jgi:16S rRNA (cytosine1402-N4)-methyltransferase